MISLLNHLFLHSSFFFFGFYCHLYFIFLRLLFIDSILNDVYDWKWLLFPCLVLDLCHCSHSTCLPPIEASGMIESGKKFLCLMHPRSDYLAINDLRG
jgi:hypothetical protein